MADIFSFRFLLVPFHIMGIPVLREDILPALVGKKAQPNEAWARVRMYIVRRGSE